MLAWLLAKQIASLFLIMGAAFVLVKLKFVGSKDSRIVSLITIYLVLPCVFVNAMLVERTESLMRGLLLSLFAAVVIHALLFLLCAIWSRFSPLDEIERASVIYTNSGNLIIPLVAATVGPQWVAYTIGYLLVQNVLLWTHGRSIIAREPSIDVKRIFTNNIVLSIAIGVAIFLSGIQLPSVVTDAVHSLSAAVGPLSMIMLGMIFAGTDLKQIFTHRRVFMIAALRMLLFPALTVLLLRAMPLADLVPEGSDVLLISVLGLCAPSGVSVTQIAQLCDNRPTYAGAINVLTTLSCVATMPLMVLLYGY